MGFCFYLRVESNGLASELVEPLLSDDVTGDDDGGGEDALLAAAPHHGARPHSHPELGRPRRLRLQHGVVVAGDGGAPAPEERRSGD